MVQNTCTDRYGRVYSDSAMRYPPDNDDLGAIALLNHHIGLLRQAGGNLNFAEYAAAKTLYHALCHLARPDRDVYPNRRHGRKVEPITR